MPPKIYSYPLGDSAINLFWMEYSSNFLADIEFICRV